MPVKKAKKTKKAAKGLAKGRKLEAQKPLAVQHADLSISKYVDKASH